MFPDLKRNIKPVVLKMVNDIWRWKKGERILIITDFPSADDFINRPITLIQGMLERNLLAKTIYDIIYDEITADVKIYFMSPTFQHNKDPNDEVLKEEISEANIIFSLTEFSLSYVPLIDKVVREKRARHCSSPLLPVEVFYTNGPIDVDVTKIKKITNRLKKILLDANLIVIEDLSDSRIEIELDQRYRGESYEWYFEEGLISELGITSNLPAGEIGIDFFGTSVKSKGYNINAKLNIFPGWLEELTSQMTMIAKNSKITEVKGGGVIGQKIRELLQMKKEVYISQIGIGTNPKAKFPLSPAIADKFIGLFHINISPLFREHFYIPVSTITVDGKKYTRKELFSA